MEYLHAFWICLVDAMGSNGMDAHPSFHQKRKTPRSENRQPGRRQEERRRVREGSRWSAERAEKTERLLSKDLTDGFYPIHITSIFYFFARDVCAWVWFSSVTRLLVYWDHVKHFFMYHSEFSCWVCSAELSTHHNSITRWRHYSPTVTCASRCRPRWANANLVKPFSPFCPTTPHTPRLPWE